MMFPCGETVYKVHNFVSFMVPLLGMGSILAEFSRHLGLKWQPDDDRLWLIGALVPLIFYVLQEYNLFYRLTQAVLTIDAAFLAYMSWEGNAVMGFVAAICLLVAYQGFSGRTDDLVPKVLSYYATSLFLLSAVNLISTFGVEPALTIDAFALMPQFIFEESPAYIPL
ncbi:unnamed protein product [Notodromas monacha]|uniref:Uncharacterized protein n=1 Tax=Notodromas monacha TaxID=399045 RepID=A0A7R9BGB7_9CRUS|nr:unnamed protein product [Notodromas monacha]CAG0914956.1 unnamed protein product [Notodromas monacha]